MLGGTIKIIDFQLFHELRKLLDPFMTVLMNAIIS